MGSFVYEERLLAVYLCFDIRGDAFFVLREAGNAPDSIPEEPVIGYIERERVVNPVFSIIISWKRKGAKRWTGSRGSDGVYV